MNGVHRIVGGINYLVATNGIKNAYFKNAQVCCHDLQDEFIQFLRNLNLSGYKVFMNRINKKTKESGLIIIAAKGAMVDTFTYQNGVIKTLSRKNYLHVLVVKFLKAINYLEFGYAVSNKYMKILLKDNWRH